MRLPNLTALPVLAALLILAGLVPLVAGPQPALAHPEAAPVDEVTAHPEVAAQLEAAPLDEATVRDTFDAWLKAQNSADFGAYAGLYAARFYGVKRSGPRTYAFDRAGWLKDRKRMFGPAVGVQATELTLRVGARTATVEFTQTWSSGKYKDVGPKRLVMVPSAAGPRIAREEMMASTIVGGGAVTPLDAALFRFALVEDHPYVVLEADVPKSRGEGPPVALSTGVTRRALKDPGASAAWVGRAVTLYGPEGAVCAGKVAELALMGRVIPHFGAVQAWQGFEGEPAMSPERIAEEAFGMAEGGYLVVGRIDQTADACKGAHWARAADAPEPRTLAPVKDIAPALKKRAWKQLRALKGYKAVARQFQEEASDRSPGMRWEQYQSVTSLDAWGADGAPQVLVARAVAGGGCGGFTGSLWAAFQVGPKGRLTLLTHDVEPGEPKPIRSVVDLDGDGAWELLAPETQYRRGGGPILRQTDQLPLPDHDCPC